MKPKIKSGTRLRPEWALCIAAAIFACVTAAAATSGVAVTVVEAIVEAVTPTPPPAVPPRPFLPAGAPVPERRVYLRSPDDEIKRDPGAPKRPAAFVEPAKDPGAYVEGPLPERARVGREDPAMCSLQCQAPANASLRYCEGNADAATLAKVGRSAPSPTCRQEIAEAFRACLAGCGIELKLPPPRPGTAPPSRRVPEAGRP
jgi:hypothetical protein